MPLVQITSERIFFYIGEFYTGFYDLFSLLASQVSGDGLAAMASLGYGVAPGLGRLQNACFVAECYVFVFLFFSIVLYTFLTFIFKNMFLWFLWFQ